MQRITLRVSNLMEMEKIARTLADYFNNDPAIIFLDGDLGAGKTTFTQYFADGLGVKEVVTSPTFNIFKRYKGDQHYLNHFDLYRIQDKVFDNGFEEYWYNEDDVSIIEWSTYLPNEFRSMFSLQLTFKSVNEDIREIDVLGKNSIIAYIKEKCNELIY